MTRVGVQSNVEYYIVHDLAKADRTGEAGGLTEKNYVPIGGLREEQGREVRASEDEVHQREDVEESKCI